MLHRSAHPSKFVFVAATVTAFLFAAATHVFADPLSPSQTGPIPGSPECAHLRNDDAKFGEYADCEFNASVRRTKENDSAAVDSDRQIACGKYLKALLSSGVIYPRTGEVITKVTINRLAPGGKITPNNMCDAVVPFAGLLNFKP